MYVRDLLMSLLRRWYVIVVGLLVTVALCGVAFIKVPLAYEATGSVLLLPPKSSVGSGGNPYLYLGGLAQAVEVLTARLNATQLRKPIEQAHPDATIEVGQDATSTGPLLAITVSSSSQEETLATVQTLMAQVPGALTGMQDDLEIPDRSRIGSLVLTNPTEAERLSKARNRAVIAIGGVGAAGTVLLAGLIDGLLMARKRRKAELAPDWKTETPDAGPDDGGDPTAARERSDADIEPAPVGGRGTASASPSRATSESNAP